MHSTTLRPAQRQLLAAPVLGALAGFLCNRAHAGSTGWAMLAEMLAGSALFLVGAVIMDQLESLAAEKARRLGLQRARARHAEHQAEVERRAALLRLERQHFQHARAALQRQIESETRAKELEQELARTRRDTVQLANTVVGLVNHVRLAGLGGPAELAAEAKVRMESLEAAQQELLARQVELDRKTAAEAAEVKSRLLELSITDSQRQRNIAGPEQDSGRIIELEGRIRKLAREIERLSQRQLSVPEAGEASKVAAGGTGDGARLGFLKAMLQANQTLRRQIKSAA